MSHTTGDVAEGRADAAELNDEGVLDPRVTDRAHFAFKVLTALRAQSEQQDLRDLDWRAKIEALSAQLALLEDRLLDTTRRLEAESGRARLYEDFIRRLVSSAGGVAVARAG